MKRVVVSISIVTLALSLPAYILVVVLFPPRFCHAAVSDGSSPLGYEEVSIAGLVAQSAKYDDKRVYIKGEVIGDLMARRDGVWVNVLDNGVAVGVFMSKEFSERIKVCGRYGYTGDLVAIKGIFNHACPIHSGEPDIHCEDLSILQRGREIPVRVSPERVYLGVASLLLSGILYVAARSKGKMR